MYKLVRDNIPSIMTAKGLNPEYYVADAIEIKDRIIEKLYEEIDEFLNCPSEEEMADIEEVLNALKLVFKLDTGRVSKIKRKKLKENGGFCLNYILKLEQ